MNKIAFDRFSGQPGVSRLWLDRRVHQPNIHLHEKTVIVSATEHGEGSYDVVLDDGSHCNVHHVILATGYQPMMANVRFLDRGTILDSLATVEGFPTLDPEFQAVFRTSM